MPKLIQRVANIADAAAGFLRSLDRDNAVRDGEVSKPLTPKHPPGTPPRSFRTDASTNLGMQPRVWPQVQLTAFSQLRALADFDLVRICIQDVMGQVLGMEWEVRVKQEHKEKAEELQGRVDEIKLAVEKPDPLSDLSFKEWLSRVLDEVLVTDALTLFPRKTRAGEPIGLEQADGATIIPLVDSRGRPPVDPAAPAYHQIIDGQVDASFTRDELWYMPRVRRPDTPYGRSPVEAVLYTVNLAIRGINYDLGWYTTGSIPDSVAFVPPEWTPEQISTFQTLFDEQLQANVQRRSGGVRFLPGGPGAGYQATKSKDWVYEYQEWLARVVCWAFGVSPMPIAKVMNRATAEMQEMSTLESGVRPIADFIQLVLNKWIQGPLGAPEIEFAWGEDETEDPAVTISRQQAMVAGGALEIDEWRAQTGHDPVLDGELQTLNLGPLISTPTGPVFLRDLLDEREARMEAKKAALERIASGGSPFPPGDDEPPEPDDATGDPGGAGPAAPGAGGAPGDEETAEKVSRAGGVPSPQGLAPPGSSSAIGSAHPDLEMLSWDGWPTAFEKHRQDVLADTRRFRAKKKKLQKAGKPCRLGKEFKSTVLSREPDDA